MSISNKFPTDEFGPWHESYVWLPAYCLDVRRLVWLRKVYRRYVHLAGWSDVAGLDTQYRLIAAKTEQAAS